MGSGEGGWCDCERPGFSDIMQGDGRARASCRPAYVHTYIQDMCRPRSLAAGHDRWADGSEMKTINRWMDMEKEAGDGSSSPVRGELLARSLGNLQERGEERGKSYGTTPRYDVA